jgi:hypothetical protein
VGLLVALPISLTLMTEISERVERGYLLTFHSTHISGYAVCRCVLNIKVSVDR